MELERAIEILEDLPVGGQQILLDDRLDACGLGIEALERELKNRQGTFAIPLPSETVDDDGLVPK